jgi:hypothetical protein
MGRGGTGLSSCASAWSGAAVISKKDRHHIAAGSLPSMVLSPSEQPVRAPMRLTETTAALGRLSGRTAIVGEASGPTKGCGISVPRARIAALSPNCRSFFARFSTDRFVAVEDSDYEYED